MDAKRFDAFTRSLSTRPSRRALVAGLVGTGAVLLPFEPGDEVAAKHCPPCRKKKQGKCKKKRPDGTVCGEEKVCQAGRCVACIPLSPGSPICTPGSTRCCIGQCVLVEPDTHLCVLI